MKRAYYVGECNRSAYLLTVFKSKPSHSEFVFYSWINYVISEINNVYVAIYKAFITNVTSLITFLMLLD